MADEIKSDDDHTWFFHVPYRTGVRESELDLATSVTVLVITGDPFDTARLPTDESNSGCLNVGRFSNSNTRSATLPLARNGLTGLWRGCGAL